MTVDDRVDVTALALTATARESQMFVSGDSRVSEADAAALLGYSADTLAKKRQQGSGPPAYAIGLNGSRVSYRISDLAAWIESARENFDSDSH